MDRALEPVKWTAAWHVYNKLKFDGKADTKTDQMQQLASVWTAHPHPDRLAQCFRHVNRGKPLIAGYLLAKAPLRQAPPQQYIPKPAAPGERHAEYKAALYYHDAGDYSIWQSGRMSLVAAVALGELADAEGCELWSTWTATAPAERQVRNHEARYSPATMWENKPTFTTDPRILTRSLFARARERAAAIFKAEWPGPLSDHGLQAKRYLKANHRNFFRHLQAAA